MTLSARRLLALAALAGAAGVATAQALPSGAQARAVHRGVAAKTKAKAKAGTNAKAQTRARPKARAVKLTGGVAWAPAGALASERVPLTGTARPGTGGGAPTGSGTSAGSGGGTGAGGGAPGTGGTATGPLPDAPPQQQALGVTVDERNGYTMLLSRTTLATGAVVIQLNNAGEDPHNLRIVRTSPAGGGATDFPDTDKQSQTTRTLTLASGTYYLYCTLQQPFSHEAAGMHATLRIDP